jgi:hypothetical protein
MRAACPDCSHPPAHLNRPSSQPQGRSVSSAGGRGLAPHLYIDMPSRVHSPCHHSPQCVSGYPGCWPIRVGCRAWRKEGHASSSSSMPLAPLDKWTVPARLPTLLPCCPSSRQVGQATRQALRQSQVPARPGTLFRVGTAELNPGRNLQVPFYCRLSPARNSTRITSAQIASPEPSHHSIQCTQKNPISIFVASSISE